MSYSNIIQQINQKKFASVYFLTGEEPYFIDKIAQALKNCVVEEPGKAFDQTIKYGKDTSIEEVIAMAKRYPMMGDRQLVLIKGAEALSRQMDKLGDYLENPLETTVLALAYHGTLDKRKKVSKLLSTVGVYYESKPLYQNQLAQWIKVRAGELALSLEEKAIYFIAEHVGVNLSLLDKELIKLKSAITHPEKEKIGISEVATHLGFHRDYNIFEFRKALAKKDDHQLFKISDYFMKNEKKNPFLMILGSLYTFFSSLQRYHTIKGQSPSLIAKELKINPYFLEEYAQAAKHYSLRKLSRIMEGLADLDAKAKGIGVSKISHGGLLKELMIVVQS